MNEQEIANQLAASIPQPAPEAPAAVDDAPDGPSAFHSHVELNDPMVAAQLADYFHLDRIARHTEDSQRAMREIYSWAAGQAQTDDYATILRYLLATEQELGIAYKPDRLARMAKFVSLKKQTEALRMQMEMIRHG